jgi:ABC-2 type transport system ATP-binding protein
LSQRILAPKIANILGGGANCVATGNPGCLLQIAGGLETSGHAVPVMHLVELLDRPVASYSGGERRRLEIARSLLSEPAVLFLDEPTAGVDVELRQSLWGFIRKLNRDGHTIILTTHYLEEAEALCGRIAMLKAGKVVALDTTQNLLSSFAGLTVRLTVDALPEAWQDRVQRHEARTYLLTLADYAELERLLAALRERAIAIEDLSLQEADLEQVFLRIMKRAA